ncbi:hypothetical protein Lqui_2169 [Legionella quinlivanii]|uniref:TenA family transcriptional regulator n=1 Tax=Legionella quinlivanii TaxID=45073 RepID=A0A0W0XSY1_9GAMM|nr:iron-containing redox enzyme family protein [Legionella quinlivanii]KTD47905.1 hypothetical protein Lqui_2169 [Legionella quinlivanii]SEG37004.1 Iron-containing redox enzyme [Legionella quinlivanii DSM 21216]STY10101.1 Pyrroloquinoline quinone (Coenzyme PQQ) biosynthesis protein C [Legionella quinlivanii]
MGMYERLQEESSEARQKFMSVPFIKGLLSGSEDLLSLMQAVGKDGLKDIYINFLLDSYQHVRMATTIYAMAGARVAEENKKVRIWLLNHAVDEYGHHEWIANDLKALGVDTSTLATRKQSVHADCLVAWLYYIAYIGNPMSILADSFVIEGLSQLFASQASEILQSELSLPDEALTYLARHGIADQGHMEELKELINENVTKESDYQDMLQCAKVEFELYSKMMLQLDDRGVL